MYYEAGQQYRYNTIGDEASQILTIISVSDGVVKYYNNTRDFYSEFNSICITDAELRSMLSLIEEPLECDIDKPSYYNWIPGIECKEVTRHFNYNKGCAIKYIWRAGRKANEIEDLKKAINY